MKHIFSTLLVTAAVGLSAHAVEIKKWDFNSETDFNVPETGTLEPSVGSGTPAQAVGGVGNKFGAVSGGGSTDTSFDNSQWRLGSDLGTGGFPLVSESNKTAGGQFMANTAGYQNIQVSWDQENSASASRYWRVQYTTNGIDWLDHSAVITANHMGPSENPTGTPTWQLGLTADFTATEGANNNPDFGFRLVSEFESTATGAGLEAYIANRPDVNYSVNGTLWLDMVTVTGDIIDAANEAPTISAIEDVKVLVGDAIAPIVFTVSDVETAANALVVSAVSSDTNLVNTFSFGGSGSDRTITVTPEAGVLGTAIITVRVEDAGGKITGSSFYVSIVEPLISAVPTQLTSWDVPVNVSFSVTNLPNDSSTWVVTGNSSNQEIVTDANLVFGGSGADRTLTITPEANAIGETVITLVAVSGGRQATTNFVVKVLPDFVVGYSLTELPNAVVESAPATLVVEGLSATDVVRGPTLEGSNLTRGYSSKSWDSTAPSRANALLGDYFEFTVTVGPGFSASLSSIDVSLRRSALNGPMNFEWLYSFDGFATPGVSMASFNYYGRSSGTAPATVEPYKWMTSDVAGQGDGNPMATMDLTSIPGLQNIPAGTTITFRLIGWGNASTTDTNTVALGRDGGPFIRGTVFPSGTTAATLNVVRVGSSIQISWPTSANGTLQGVPALGGTWADVSESAVEDGGTSTVTISASGDQQFFRLRQ